MGIINVEVSPSGVSVMDVVSEIKGINSNLYATLVSSNDAIVNLIRNHAEHEPSDILDGFGDDRQKLEEFMFGLNNLIHIVNPEYKQPNGL